MTTPDQAFADRIVTPGTPGLPERFFDRFVFNLHPVDATSPSVVLGCGLHPVRDTVDGFAIITTAGEQRNLRFATELSATDWSACGPLEWEVTEPNRMWRLALRENPIGLTLDVEWRARTPAWWGTVAVDNADGAATSFDHLFQSGHYTGVLGLDGHEQRVDGWYGQRDRSRGVRTMTGGQGLHVWFQAQLPDRSVGFLLVEDRTGGRILLEGAVMHTDGRLDDVVDVRHAFGLDDIDLRDGTVEVRTESGELMRIGVDARAGGGFMAGGGYGGHHGSAKGRDHVESDVYPLDGSVSQRTLDSSLTDRLCAFDWDGLPGTGILEFALTRSPSYRYLPTLR